jgi:hypothetical protein
MSGTTSNLTGNFISFLQSQRSDNPVDPVEARLLTVMQKVQLLPLPEVLGAAGVTEVDAPNLVERLRAQGLVELVEKEGQKDRFLRLTPRGFEKASALSTS